MLGLSPRWTVLDLVQSPGDLDAEKLAGFVTRQAQRRRPAAGADAARTRRSWSRSTASSRCWRWPGRAYDAVVIDTSSQFAPATLLAIDHTDTLLLVGASDVPTIKSLKIALETLELLEVQPDRRADRDEPLGRQGRAWTTVTSSGRCAATSPTRCPPTRRSRSRSTVASRSSSTIPGRGSPDRSSPRWPGRWRRRSGAAVKPDRSRTLGGPHAAGEPRRPAARTTRARGRPGPVCRDQVRGRPGRRRARAGHGAARGRGARGGRCARQVQAGDRRGAGRGRHPAVDRPTARGWCARSPRTSSATARSSRSWPTSRSPR